MLVTWLPDAELPFSVSIPFSNGLCIAILMYAWLASFAMIGGVLFVRRDVLGFVPSHSPERSAEKAEKERQREIDRLIDRIFAEWRGGAYGNAWRTIEKHLASSARPSDELQALFQRASQWPDKRLAHRLAQELIPHLLTARRTGDALKVARAQLQADVNFRPLKSDRHHQIDRARPRRRRSSHRSTAARRLSPSVMRMMSLARSLASWRNSWSAELRWPIPRESMFMFNRGRARPPLQACTTAA